MSYSLPARIADNRDPFKISMFLAIRAAGRGYTPDRAMISCPSRLFRNFRKLARPD